MVDQHPESQALDTTADDSLLDLAKGKNSVEPLTVLRMPCLVETYYVSGAELDSLASGHSSIHLTLLGIVVGASVTLLLTLLTVQLSDRQHATVVTLAASSVLATLYFAARAWVDVRKQSEQVRLIKHNRTQKASALHQPIG